ncbi:MAG: winged helix DNA-binding domain-containing protein [Chloroflexota bacterium]|nr:winged helix DNA-binding domain-containing protein [Chloroflexota bacterium]
MSSISPVAERLTLDEARMLAVIAQRLDRRPAAVRSPERVKQRLLETVRHLGCVQIDTISVISRSHETVLWSRLGAFDPALFDELYYPDGALMEYWAHAAAFVPIEALPFYLRAMAKYRERYETPGSWAEREAATLDRVLAAIRERGPLGSRHFERSGGPRADPWTWWGGKPERQALDHLWSRGDLMVQRRQGFQRTYDLTERMAPELSRGEPPSEAAEQRHFVATALRAMGIGTAAWVADYFRTGWVRHVDPRSTGAELALMASEGLAVPAEVEGLQEPAWLDPTMLPKLAELRSGRGRPTLTTLLSPFDNLIWYRPRTAALFGFEYRIECYTPAAKRIYGYYTLPILHRGRLVGRIDPSYDRRHRRLTIKAVHLEPRVRPTPALASAVAVALRDLSGFLGGGEITVLRSDPEPFGAMLSERMMDYAEAPEPALERQ